jgi:hypothetical protein
MKAMRASCGTRRRMMFMTASGSDPDDWQRVV